MPILLAALLLCQLHPSRLERIEMGSQAVLAISTEIQRVRQAEAARANADALAAAIELHALLERRIALLKMGGIDVQNRKAIGSALKRVKRGL